MSIGGPAFPVPDVLNSNGQIQPSSEAGMTLRDYLAAQALIGLLSRPVGTTVMQNPQQRFAETAYAYADAMIAARGK
ncbi:hypothetical protein AWB80_03082 [Caballeronia pedi]|uniref:Uncharacterized protein n=1 Tax=Caballeronia pedi TaxID=1777141 RepID=A0A158B6B1_9BURK|nr:hypothetical protein [Caballeronia pedi]SAK65539.1 hypothetical protein AWB80_03082 [Caballeronia pedi]